MRKDAGREFKRHLAQEFNADFMIAAPDHPALPARCRPSCQMEREALRKIINVTDRKPRPYLTYVDQYASFENAAGRSFNPGGLIDCPPKK